MMDRMFERFMKSRVGVLPTCKHYAELVDMAVVKLGITKEEARKRYGHYTYAEWAKLLEYEEVGIGEGPDMG